MVIIKEYKNSFMKYEKKMSLILFLAGCNFHCYYCNREDLVYPEPPFISEEEILSIIDKNKRLIEVIEISGGEPTIQKDLPNFIKKIKDKGLLVKLYTNGSNPKMIKELIDNKLIDYISMDVKAPIEKYEKMTQSKVNKKLIKESINILKNSNINYEFRTTILPYLISKQDLINIGYLLEGSNRLIIQNFNNSKTLDKSFNKKKSYLKPELEHFVRILKPFIKEVVLE